MRATYSVEDNKLRLYAEHKLSQQDYEDVKAAGFTWAAKQECFVAPMWTPRREDLLYDLCGEIEDEDYSPTERAADRAERFGDYRDKRAAEAGASADTFDAGPGAFGHQNRARAERLAARHDRHRCRALSQWGKAEYWQSRTEGVIRSALYKSSPAVRRSRILRLEAEQRKHEAGRREYAERYAAWQRVPALEGADAPAVYQSTANFVGLAGPVSPALKLAYSLANHVGCYGEYAHPRTGRKTSLYSHMTDPQDPLTPRELAALWLAGKLPPGDPDAIDARWSEHYERRLTYERAMLAAEGGTAADAEMVPGGWVKAGSWTGTMFKAAPGGWMQIHAVTRSPATKKVTSVKVMGMVGYDDPKPGLVSINVQRLPEGNYRAPTPEELEAFQAAQKAAKAEKKATAPPKPPLINPTDEDAEKLQQLLNPKGKVVRLTQAQYSANSKGEYGKCETVEVSEKLDVRHRWGMYHGPACGRVTVFEVRTVHGNDVVILTDKPQKPIPWDAVTQARAMQPSESGMAEKMAELIDAMGTDWLALGNDERKLKLIDDARYVGWVAVQSASQRNWTDKGREALAAYRAAEPAAV